ncbi:DDE_3 domain-containing protein [Trichonephila clavipes]|nr:DDE_3 domain-containing protein [Trichonephila clavipes]
MERTRDPLLSLQCLRRLVQGSGGLILWTGITLDSRTHLYVFARGTVTAVRNMDLVLEPYVRLFTGATNPDFILMHGNARNVELILESGDIRLMDRPVRSPDVIRLEHAWDALGMTIATRNPY